MPDPNTDPSPGINFPDIHVHIMAIFHCTVCDDVLMGCYTCHAEQCYDDEEDFFIPGEFTYEVLDPRDCAFEFTREGYVVVEVHPETPEEAAVRRALEKLDELLSHRVREWRTAPLCDQSA